MPVMQSGISWTNSTWNPTTGCTKVSAGCDHCYAEDLTRRWGRDFSKVEMHPDRLRAVRSFGPLREEDGERGPRLVFVNSMSDLMHSEITDAFRDACFDAMASMPTTIFQVLTKRPMTLARYAQRRWGSVGVPLNVWLGASVEDNRVAGRLDILRRIKRDVGAFTAFASVEPLIGPVDRVDFASIDWVIIGGESGNRARICDAAWARQARDRARLAGAAVFLKQWGTWASNPLYAASNRPTHLDRVRHAIEGGELHAAIVGGEIDGEKGGATLDGESLRAFPPAWERMRALIRAQDLARKGQP